MDIYESKITHNFQSILNLFALIVLLFLKEVFENEEYR